MNAPRSFETRDGASEAALSAAQRDMGLALPADYLDWKRQSNGGSGFIDDCFLALWPIEEVKRLSDGYQEGQSERLWLFFGSNGGGEGFAFDLRFASMPIVEAPFITLDPDDALFCATSFAEFMKRPTGFPREDEP
jgi:hypothetical protein